MSTELLNQIGETLTELVAFALFFWIMKRYAWGPVMRLLDDRRRGIEEGFADVERQRAEAVRLREQYQEHLDRIEQEARVRIQEAVTEGRRVADEMREQARRETERLHKRARRSIEVEYDQARVRLRDDIVAMTVGSTERLLRHKLDDAEDRRLVAAFVDEIENRE